jgi:tryptophanyl-tRNA synthetase
MTDDLLPDGLKVTNVTPGTFERQRQAEEDYETKVRQRDALVAYYETRRTDLKLDDLTVVKRLIGESSRFVTRDIIYAHKDFDLVLDAIYEGRDWAVVSGLNPSGQLHLGHKAMFDVLLWLQRDLGATVYIPITNDETYLAHKAGSLSESAGYAYEDVIPSIIALGFDPAKTKIFVHTDYPPIHKLALSVSRLTTYNTVRALFGWTGSESPGLVYYMGALQFASMLLPQLPEFGGPKPVLIPVGIDQHPYVCLARDVAQKLRIVPPAELVWKFLPGLRSPDTKMSKSDPEHAIFFDDSPDQARRKIRKAYSGGNPLASFHRQFGAIPEVCSAFNLLSYNFLDEDQLAEVRARYAAGEFLTSQVKEMAIDLVCEFLKDHQKAREAARSRVSDYMLTADVPSILANEHPFSPELLG